MAKKYFERNSLARALNTYLTSLGYNNLTITEGWRNNDVINPPHVNVYFLPSRYLELQMGRTNERSFVRRVQIDVYMTTEDKADAITEDIAEYLDNMTINVSRPDNSLTGGLLLCPDSETITMETLPPVMVDPKVKRWRGVVQATLEAHYLSS